MSEGKSIDSIRLEVQKIKNETTKNANTATRVGGVLEDIVDNTEDFQESTTSRVDASLNSVNTAISAQNSEIKAFKEAITDQVNNYPNVTIEGDVTNAADEEDLTADADGLLKLKNRSAVGGMGYVVLRKSKSFASQVTSSNTIYEIRYDFNLVGSTVTIPNKSVLKFNGGSITNGTLSGNLYFEGIVKDSLNCNIAETSKVLSHLNYYSTMNSSILTKCYAGISVMEDCSFSNSLTLNTSINGNNNTLTFANTVSSAGININSNGVSISNCKIKKLLPTGIDTILYRLAIYGEDVSNVTINSNEINGGIEFKATEGNYVDNIIIANNKITCNFQQLGEGGYKERDLIHLTASRNIFIENNIIDAKHVNRVFKTSTNSFPANPIYVTSNIVIRNNNISSESTYGKQIWDNYDGTANTLFENNIVNVKGHSRVYENKTVLDMPFLNNNIIRGNSFTIENGDLLLFNANSKTSYIVENNNVCFVGSGTYQRLNTEGGTPESVTPATIMFLQGSPKEITITGNKFVANDSYIGKFFIEGNSIVSAKSIIIKDNIVENLSRTAFQNSTINIERLVYRNNIKSYTSAFTASKMDLNLVNCKIGVADIFIPKTDFAYPIIIGGELTIGTLFLDCEYGEDNGSVISPINMSSVVELSNIISRHKIYRNGDKRYSFVKDNLSTRPTLSNGWFVGYNFFDTSIGQVIWWNGTAWVNALGAEL